LSRRPDRTNSVSRSGISHHSYVILFLFSALVRPFPVNLLLCGYIADYSQTGGVIRHASRFERTERRTTVLNGFARRPALLSDSRSFRSEQMPYSGLAARMAAQSFFDITIRLRQALVLTQMLRPRMDDKGF
jgi:hypothetical protein